jgi:hypothetical protein
VEEGKQNSELNERTKEARIAGVGGFCFIDGHISSGDEIGAYVLMNESNARAK